MFLIDFVDVSLPLRYVLRAFEIGPGLHIWHTGTVVVESCLASMRKLGTTASEGIECQTFERRDLWNLQSFQR
jgi:hypothetical protein